MAHGVFKVSYVCMKNWIAASRISPNVCIVSFYTLLQILSVSVFEIHKASDALIHNGQVFLTQATQELRAQRNLREVAHHFYSLDQRIFLVNGQRIQVAIIEIDQSLQAFARLEV